jgi:hypothetical protein
MRHRLRSVRALARAGSLVLVLGFIGAACNPRSSSTASGGGGVIDGHVRTPGGDGIEGARVTASGGESRTATTSFTGFYQKGVPPGDYTVTATATGFTCDAPRQLSATLESAVEASFT